MPHESILAHLVHSLTNQVENVATEALAHLLLEYPVLKEAFRAYISSAGVDLPGHLKIQTQARWLDAAIPDLAGVDEQNRPVLVVESKFWAPLTKNQPAAYLKRLPAGTPAVLLFIAPESRMPTLWQELLNQCRSCAISLPGLQDSAAEHLLFLRVNQEHVLALTGWESLLAALHAKAVQTNDGHAAGDVWQVQSLCAKIDAEAFHPLTEAELKSPTEKRIQQFKELLDELVSLLVEQGVVSVEGYRATPGPRSYKRYLSIQGLPKSIGASNTMRNSRSIFLRRTCGSLRCKRRNR